MFECGNILDNLVGECVCGGSCGERTPPTNAVSTLATLSCLGSGFWNGGTSTGTTLTRTATLQFSHCLENSIKATRKLEPHLPSELSRQNKIIYLLSKQINFKLSLVIYDETNYNNKWVNVLFSDINTDKTYKLKMSLRSLLLKKI